MDYSIMVKSVGDLIRMGVWYSDACEVVMRFSDPSKHIDENEFEDSVNLYLHDKNVPIPKYKPIY